MLGKTGSGIVEHFGLHGRVAIEMGTLSKALGGVGGFVADERTLDELEGEGRVVFRYAGDNPNGSYRAIAGITNERGNVVGLMPHPEHAVEQGYGPSTDGLPFFTSVLSQVVNA